MTADTRPLVVYGAPVATQQHPVELLLLLDIYQRLRPSRVLEIGSLYGGTLYHWMSYAPGAVIVSVDLPLNNEAQQARGQWPHWAKTFGVDLVAIQGNSHHAPVIEQVSTHAPYDFIFVDGDHYLPGVQQDFENYYPMLRSGGCMAFHDICTPDNSTHIHVGRWWRELVCSSEHLTQELIREGADESGGIGIIWKPEEGNS